jgi:hypothetical protein
MQRLMASNDPVIRGSLAAMDPRGRLKKARGPWRIG